MEKFYELMCRTDHVDQPGAILRVTGDRNIPLMDALLELCRTQPETLEGLVEVIPEEGEILHVQEVCQFRPLRSRQQILGLQL